MIEQCKSCGGFCGTQCQRVNRETYNAVFDDRERLKAEVERLTKGWADANLLAFKHAQEIERLTKVDVEPVREETHCPHGAELYDYCKLCDMEVSEQLSEDVEPVAWCNDRVLRGDVGECASAAAIRYWSKGDWVDKRRVEDMKHPLVPASALAALRQEVEQLRVQLAGCGVAAMQNTESSKEQRAKRGDYGYSESYADVCRAVDREIELRTQLAEAQADAARYRYINELCCQVGRDAESIVRLIYNRQHLDALIEDQHVAKALKDDA